MRIKVPQWREDVLAWAAKQGYKETGGGVWGELDGESAADLTRPTRYFLLTVRARPKTKETERCFSDGVLLYKAAHSSDACMIHARSCG